MLTHGGSEDSFSALRSVTLGRERDLVPIRRFDAQQVVDEIIVAVVLGRQNRHAMVLARDEQHIEVFMGFDQRVHHLHRGRRIYVTIQFPDNDQRLAL